MTPLGGDLNTNAEKIGRVSTHFRRRISRTRGLDIFSAIFRKKYFSKCSKKQNLEYMGFIRLSLFFFQFFLKAAMKIKIRVYMNYFVAISTRYLGIFSVLKVQHISQNFKSISAQVSTPISLNLIWHKIVF